MITEEQDAEMQAERLVQLKAQHPDGDHPELRAIGWPGEPESPTQPAKAVDEKAMRDVPPERGKIGGRKQDPALEPGQ